MTLFEFLSVAISIVLALSAGQLLTNLREVFHPARRYWVHAVWVVHLLVIHVFIWWSLWAYRDVEGWNLLTFGMVLITPGLLFVCSSALVPSYASRVASWEEYFYEVRRWFFAARALLVVGAGLRNWYLLDKAPLGSPTPFSGFVMIAAIIGFFSSNRRIHGVPAS